MMIDWLGGMNLEINYPKLVILRDQKDDGAVDNNGEIWKEMPVSAGKTGSLSHINVEETNGPWELNLPWPVHLTDGLQLNQL